jgi:G3E family GTPase
MTKTPLMLITGSLGSGKTTLLRRILEVAPFRVAVLMNEFGEIAIDSRVIKGANVEIVELAGGCVCCSMTGEFEAAVKEIISTVGPDFIVVEATGVAESDALVYEVEDNLAEVRLDSVICIVDSDLSVRYPHVGFTARTQIASADIILINKTDLVTNSEAETVEAQVRNYNDRAALLRTVNCSVDTALLFGSGAGQRSRSPVVRAGTDLVSFTWSTEKALDSEKFEQLLGALPGEVLRAKGFVRFEDGGRLFNYVVGRSDFEEFEVERTDLVFIGPRLDEARSHIVQGLQKCEVN